jgi:MFS family permease
MGLDRGNVLAVGILAAGVFATATWLSGVYSDRIGRKQVLLGSCLVAVPWGLLLFPLLDRGGAVAFAIGLSGSLAIMGISYGPAGALLPEMFKTEYRYTGAGMAYHLAGVIGGGTAPIFAADFAEAGNISAIGWMMAGFAALSVLCSLLLPETSRLAMAATRAQSGQPAVV